MPDSIKLTTLTAAIAGQTVTVTKPDGTSGTLTIKDLAGIPAGINTQDCPILAPRPANFVSNVSIKRDTYGADAAYKSIQYDLTYQLFFYPVGEGLNWLEYYTGMAVCAMQIMTYFATHTDLAGSTDFLPLDVPAFQAQTDAAGTPFHGAELAFRVTQYLEV